MHASTWKTTTARVKDTWGAAEQWTGTTVEAEGEEAGVLEIAASVTEEEAFVPLLQPRGKGSDGGPKADGLLVGPV